MSKSLAGRVALITGASHGIGKSIAITLADQGAKVILFSRDLESGQALANRIQGEGGQAIAYSVDVCNENLIQSAIGRVLAEDKKLDILINCVGGFTQFLPIEQISSQEWDEVFSLNLKSAFLMSRALIPNMKMHQFGRIINIGSIAGNGPNPYGTSYLPYGAAKAGLIGFTKHLAKELGPFGITVNTVSPGTTATERVIGIRDSQSLARMAEQTPMKRLVTPEDTAQAVLFLASHAASGITGVNLNVNAGAVM
jgi:NAD(P)-dependent dehydrogenase (short-subunit alcohol dehydrogenase family)